MVGLTTKYAATDATADYTVEVVWDSLVIQCISEDGGGELGHSANFQHMYQTRSQIMEFTTHYFPE